MHPRTRYRGAFRVSLLISAVLHLVAIALYSSLIREMPEWFPPYVDPTAVPRPPGMELVNLLELPTPVETEDPERVEEPEPEPEPEVPEVVAPPALPPTPVPPEEVEVEEPPTAAERLRPRAGDLRLWAPVDPDLAALSEEQVLRLMFAAELEALGDSVAAAEELARRAMDWTYADSEGRKWGVSPGKLHLGDITIPLPFAFGTPPGQRDQVRDRVWEWEQIERGAVTSEILRTLRERDEAIRRRMDAQRRADTTGVQR